MAIAGDPYNPYAPGLKQNNEVSAKTFAPGQLFQPGDPYRIAFGVERS
jgi:hypothetical protein